jgi:hypothetical protein
MKQFDPYGGAYWGKGLDIDFDNLSWSNTVLRINIITPNVTVRGPIHQPMVMAHHLCDVRFVLAAKTLLWDSKAFTSLCERPCNKAIEPLFIAGIWVMVRVISW